MYKSSDRCWKLAGLVDPLGSSWIPLINIPKCRVHDVTYCYNLGKTMPSCILIKWLGSVFLHTNKCRGLLMSITLAQRKQ